MSSPTAAVATAVAGGACSCPCALAKSNAAAVGGAGTGPTSHPVLSAACHQGSASHAQPAATAPLLPYALGCQNGAGPPAADSLSCCASGHLASDDFHSCTSLSLHEEEQLQLLVHGVQRQHDPAAAAGAEVPGHLLHATAGKACCAASSCPVRGSSTAPRGSSSSSPSGACHCSGAGAVAQQQSGSSTTPRGSSSSSPPAGACHCSGAGAVAQQQAVVGGSCRCAGGGQCKGAGGGRGTCTCAKAPQAAGGSSEAVPQPPPPASPSMLQPALPLSLPDLVQRVRALKTWFTHRAYQVGRDVGFKGVGCRALKTYTALGHALRSEWPFITITPGVQDP